MAAEVLSLRPAPVQLRILTPREKRWGIILGGDDGVRLPPLTRFISGDDRPKQFCPVVGPDILLEQAKARAARSIPAKKTILALTTRHELYYQPAVESSPSPRLLQPCNRGTAPAVVLTLSHILEQDPDALVAILPCDHHYTNEAGFTDALESAFHAARTHRDSAVLLGAPANAPEVEFGWIQLGPPQDKNLFRVQGFQPKPPIGVAEPLLKSGALWNTFVIVGRASILYWMSLVSVPELVVKLASPSLRCDRDGNLTVPYSLYAAIPMVDFSRQVLSFNAFRLLALPLQGVEWKDPGHAGRVVSVIRSRRDNRAAWFRGWEDMRPAAPDVLPQF